jgi:hypothetical protein
MKEKASAAIWAMTAFGQQPATQKIDNVEEWGIFTAILHSSMIQF